MIRCALTVLSFVLAAGAAQAQTYQPAQPSEPSRFAAGAGIGTSGVYIEGQFRVTSRISLRGAYEQVDLEHEQDVDDLTYGGRLDSSVFAGYLQIHPVESDFFISGGVLFGGREVALSAQPAAPVTIGDRIFSPGQLGRLEGEADLGDRAIALGAGWDSTFSHARGLGWRLTAGVAVGDAPTVHMNSIGGSLSNDPALQAELRREEERIADKAENLRFYPVVQLGLTWRF